MLQRIPGDEEDEREDPVGDSEVKEKEEEEDKG